MSQTPATELDELLFQAELRMAEPVTIRFCGVTDVTLPTYILYQVMGVVSMLLLIVVAVEIVSPVTSLGEWISLHWSDEPILMDIAIWTPPALLTVLLLEVIESTFVLTTFRRKFRERDERVRQQLLSRAAE
jgi:hypothetical protein